MKNRFLSLLVLIPILMSHGIWMQTVNKGKVDEPVKVHLYFGEFNHNLIEKGIKWYGSEMFEDFKAFVKPQNSDSAKPIELTHSEESMYATFTPKVPGIYQIVSYNEDGDVKDYRKHGLGLLKDFTYLRTTFEATSWRQKQEGTPDLSPMMKYDIVPFPAKNGYGDYNSHQSTWRVDEEVYAKFYIGGEPAIGKEIKVYSPDGWTSVAKTDKEGMFKFIPYKKGIYQAIYQEKKKEKGTYNGKKFDTTRIKVVVNLGVL